MNPEEFLEHEFLSYCRTRNAVIGHKDFDLTYLEEAYTSEHWLVRIYRLVRLVVCFQNIIQGCPQRWAQGCVTLNSVFLWPHGLVHATFSQTF